MRILLFDPFHGAAGDMVIGALLAVGADRSLVLEAMRSVVGEPTVDVVERGGIRALQVTTHATATKRTLSEVLARVEESQAPQAAKEMAGRVFSRLHAAEESIHGESVHFHEVGADDAVADVVGACTALHSLGVDGTAVLPIALGSGYIRGAHGTYPAPAPATVAILKEAGLMVKVSGEMAGELCTPTGAALLSEFSNIEPPESPVILCTVGYGAGKRETPGTPNVLRAMIVEVPGEFMHDSVDVLETNVDDVSGEVLSYTISRLMAEGARDVSAVPAMMKKGRIGYLVRVIAAPGDSVRLAGIMAEELGTLGIRCSTSVHRLVTKRTVESIPLDIQGHFMEIEVKCSYLGDRLIGLKPEYEQVKRRAAELHMPLKEVMRIVEEAAWKYLCRERS